MVKLIQRHIETALKERSSKQGVINGYKWFGSLLKAGISLLGLWFIYSRVQTANSAFDLVSMRSLIESSNLVLAIAILASGVLMIVNWGIEVVKWKNLIDLHQPIAWRTAIKGVLTGVSFGVFSPNRTGEFIGRILSLKPEMRIQGALMSFINGLAQTTATFAFGILGMILLLTLLGEASLGTLANTVLRIVLMMTLGLIFIFYYKLPRLGPWLAQWNRLERWQNELLALNEVSSRMLDKLLVLSLARFLTFIAQYMLLFGVFFESPKWLPLLGSSVLTLFSSTLLPFLPIPDLLLRETFALGYFELFSFDPLKVSTVVFIVWLINIAFPAFAGTIALFTYKIFKRIK